MRLSVPSEFRGEASSGLRRNLCQALRLGVKGGRGAVQAWARGLLGSLGLSWAVAAAFSDDVKPMLRCTCQAPLGLMILVHLLFVSTLVHCPLEGECSVSILSHAVADDQSIWFIILD